MTATTTRSPLPETTLQIEGMTCGACAARVDKALRSVPGVREAAVNLLTNTARVEGPADPEQLVSAVQKAGYGARPLTRSTAQALRTLSERSDREQRGQRDRLLVGVLFGIPAIAVEMALHHQAFFAIHLRASMEERYSIVSALLATVVAAFTGWPFFIRGLRAALHGNPNMDVLVALGAGTAYVASAMSLLLWLAGGHWHGAGGFYEPAISEFHAAVAIIVLITLGKYLESRAKKRASAAVASLATQSSPTATRVQADGSVERIPAEQIQVGDRLQVLAHQQVPVDGELLEGAGSLDLSILTGESLPVELSAGSSGPSALPGGSRLADGRILLRATATAATSTAARILELVNAAQASKTEIQSMADRIAGIFVPIILALATLDFVAWLLVARDWRPALLTAIATIVIACPCAMGLATPTAVTVALGRAARMGILFTKAAALESGRRIHTVLFDKTGTLTTGKLQVVAIAPAPGSGLSPERVLTLAAALEQFSDHPLATAITAEAARRKFPLPEPGRFNSIAGGGVKGTFGEKSEYAAGSPALLRSLGIAIDDSALGAHPAASVVLLTDLTTKTLLGLIALQDTLRPDSADTLRRLQSLGLQIGVLSGDTEAAVRATLRELPVDFIKAGIKPEEKAAAIGALKMNDGASGIGRSGVAFVGDGINDAPALAAADLGVAMASGADLAKAAGDVLLISNHLGGIPAMLELSRRTMRIIKQNLFWAFAYNVAAIPLAMLGILTPAIAAGAMAISSLTVVLNALRLYRVQL